MAQRHIYALRFSVLISPPHICIADFSAQLPSDMYVSLLTARFSPVPQTVVYRPHILFVQRRIYTAHHLALSLRVLCEKYKTLSLTHWVFFFPNYPSSFICSCWKTKRKNITWSAATYPFNSLRPEWRIYASGNFPPLVQIMACRLVAAKPLSKPMLEYCLFDP